MSKSLWNVCLIIITFPTTLLPAMPCRKPERRNRHRRGVLLGLVRRHLFRWTAGENRAIGMLCSSYKDGREIGAKIRRGLQVDRRTNRVNQRKNFLQKSSNGSTVVCWWLRSAEDQQSNLQSRQLVREKLRVLRPSPGVLLWVTNDLARNLQQKRTFPG